jgi:probable O-glycosylation ligase (exosortase A-associated)
MRDVFLLAFLPYLLYLTLRRPFVGAALWIWTSLFVPAAWVWGFAITIRFNLIIVIVSVASYLLYRHKPRMTWSGLASIVVLFYACFSISSFLALTETDTPFIWWDTVTRILALFFFCQLVLEKKLHWDTFVWAMVLVIGGYGMLEATKYVLSGLNHEIVGIPYGQMYDRNDLAVAMVAMIPLAVYLRSQTKAKYLRLGLLAMICMLPVAVIGTFSRGGLITLAAVGLFYLLTSGRRFVLAALAVGIIALGLSFVVTDEYRYRAQTIQAADEDESFVGRTTAWKMSIYIALDRPLVGGGPFAVQTADVWPLYIPRYDPEQWFRSGTDVDRPRAAHSMYFQVLGDTGFLGFFVYMAMLTSAILLLRKTLRAARANGDPDIAGLCKALFLSLGAILVGGAALSIAYWDLIFGLLGLTSAVGARYAASVGPARLMRAPPRRAGV